MHGLGLFDNKSILKQYELMPEGAKQHVETSQYNTNYNLILKNYSQNLCYNYCGDLHENICISSCSLTPILSYLGRYFNPNINPKATKFNWAKSVQVICILICDYGKQIQYIIYKRRHYFITMVSMFREDRYHGTRLVTPEILEE